MSEPLSTGAIAGITVAIIVVVAVVIFIGVWFGVVVPNQNSSTSSSSGGGGGSSTSSGGGGGSSSTSSTSTAPPVNSFTATWVSPMLVSPVTITPTFTFNPSTFAVVISFPGFTLTTNSSNACYGAVAPGDGSFPAKLQQIPGAVTPGSTTMNFGSGPTAATLSLYADGTLALAPNSTSFQAPSSIVVTACTISYTATSTPATLTYGKLNGGMLFSGGGLSSDIQTDVYYSTNNSSSVTLCIPSLSFVSNSSPFNTVSSVGGLPVSNPKLTPAVDISQNTNGQSYNAGSQVSVMISIASNNGAINYTLATNWATNSHSSIGFFIQQYNI